MYTKEILIKLIKKARKLKKETNMSARAIAKRMQVSKDSVNKWLKMSFTDDTKIKEEYRETR
jgi:transposase